MAGEIRTANPNRIMRLNNRICPYCGQQIASADSSTDHVIGRRFVPKGSLAASWNLLLNAHALCNAEKAEYENDISAITLQMLAASGELDSAASNVLMNEIARKGRARSSVTQRRVAESRGQHTIRTSFGLAEITFTLSGPPSLPDERVLKLAAMHVNGLATMMFADKDTGHIAYFPPSLALAVECSRSDWGNERARAFMALVRDWDWRVVGTGLADGFFQAIIRKEPGTRPVWAWALEWNQALRLMGFIGDDMTCLEELSHGLPALVWNHHWQEHDPERGRVSSRVRTETPLSAADDALFEAVGL